MSNLISILFHKIKMKSSYIRRSSYKSLNSRNPLLDINHLKTEKIQVFEKHKNNIEQKDLYGFDSVYLKKSKQSHHLKLKKDSVIVRSGIRLNVTSYSNIFFPENISDPVNHTA